MTEEMTAKLEQLAELQKKMYAFNYASSSIYLDSATVAPKDTEEGRGEALAILSEYGYDLATRKETIELLEYLNEHKDELTPHQAREVELLLHDNEFMKTIPVEEYIAYQKVLSKADYVWHKAKAENDFESFRPVLKEIFDYNIKFAKYYKPDQNPYDTQLNMFERGLTMEKCDKFFATLREHIVPLIKKICETSKNETLPVLTGFPVEKQKELTKYLMYYMGIDPNHCVCGETEHPFTLNLQRMTFALPPIIMRKTSNFPCIP